MKRTNNRCVVDWVWLQIRAVDVASHSPADVVSFDLNELERAEGSLRSRAAGYLQESASAWNAGWTVYGE